MSDDQHTTAVAAIETTTVEATAGMAEVTVSEAVTTMPATVEPSPATTGETAVPVSTVEPLPTAASEPVSPGPVAAEAEIASDVPVPVAAAPSAATAGPATAVPPPAAAEPAVIDAADTGSFAGAHPALARNLSARAYTVPTAVQLAVLEASATQGDLLVSAQTGSGKTVAFGLAIAATLLGTEERFPPPGEPLALIVAPTRELALQVQRELLWLFADMGVRIVTNVGGMDPRTEARQLAAGAHIVVGTPGRLRDQMERRRLDLSKLACIVLDEADEMLDLGFREDLEFLLDATPAERQTLLFSATMPREIETLATRYQRHAKRIETIRRHEQHADIEYSAVKVAPADVENAVVNVLRYHEMRAALVFCATRESVKRMHARLVERGFAAVALSGELSQAERTQALQAVRDGRARVLVATDVAARGLDLPDLALVIHAELPRNPETLLHRSGRTGRAGKKGLCVLIVPYSLNRKVNQLIGATRVKVTWGYAPSADEIRARDQERFLADPIFTDAAIDDEPALARALQAGRTADEIALALVRIHRARLPAPEDVAEDKGPVRHEDRPRTGVKNYERKTDHVRPSDGSGEPAPRGARPSRDDTREMVWFRLNIGRDKEADPRWLIPLICKTGNITKAEIGSIKIHDRDTRFQIVATQADAFAEAARTSKNKQGAISRVSVTTSADDAAVSSAIRAVAGGGDDAAASSTTAAAPVVAETSADKPAWKKPYEKTPYEKKPYEKKAYDKKPYDKKPYDKDATAKKPWTKAADGKGSDDKKPWVASTGYKGDKGAGDKKPWDKKPWQDKAGDDAKPYASRSAEGGDAAPAKTWTKKPWVAKTDGAPFAGSTETAEKKPWVKKPWVERTDAPASGEGATGGAASGDKKPWVKKPYEKKPWQDKASGKPDAKAGPKPHRKGGSFAAGGAKPDASVSSADAARAAVLDPSKRPSKYAHKKKNRPPEAAE